MTTFLIVGIILIVVAFVVGYYRGKSAGMDEGADLYKSTICMLDDTGEIKDKIEALTEKLRNMSFNDLIDHVERALDKLEDDSDDE